MAISGTLRNVFLAVVAALLCSTLNMLLQISVREGNFTRYMMNFSFDLMAALLTGTFVILEQRGFGLESWKLLLANAMCTWLYQWASLHALEVLPLSVVAGLNSSINPLFGAVFSALFLAEKPTCWFGVVLLRNTAVIWLMLLPLLGPAGNADVQVGVFGGILWTVVLAFSVGTSMTLQRMLKVVSPLAINFWALAVNAVLWLPPASSTSVRLPLLWPPTHNDGKTVQGSAWLWMATAAVVGSLAGVVTSKAMHEMELPAFVLVFGPVLIGMNCIFDVLSHNEMYWLTLLGLAVLVLGLIGDVALDKQVTIAQDHVDTDAAETTPLMRGGGKEHGADAKSTV